MEKEETVNKKDKRIEIMKNGNPFKAVIKMSVPVVIGMMVMVLYNLVDTYFIGKMNDPLKLAAASLSTPVMMCCIAVSSLVGTGAASYIARSLGAGKKERADKTICISVVIIVIFSALITVFGLVFMKQIVHLLGASEETSGYTIEYVSVILAGTIFVMGNYVLGQLLRAEGSTMYSMIGMLIGTVANIILDPIMIFTFGWGVRGAAIATIIGNILGTLFFIGLYHKKKTVLDLNLRLISYDKPIIKEIFYIGIPATLEQLLTTAAVIICNNLAAGYGDITVASMGVASKVMTIGNYVYMGFAAGSQPLMGYNYGAKNFKRVKDILKAAVTTTSLVELVIMAVFAVFAPNIVSLFSNDADVIAKGSIILRALMFNLPCVGATSISRITFQSMGKPMPALLITIFRQGILYVPLQLILNRVFGFQGFIHAQPLTEVIMMVVSVSFLLWFLKGEEKRVIRAGCPL